MEKNYNIIIEKGNDGYYTSQVVGLNGCHTQAKSLDKLIERTKEAIELYLECENINKKEIPNFVGLQTITI